MYIYWKSEPELWTVGYYRPDNSRETESDHDSQESAAARVHYLNGGENAENPYILHGPELERGYNSPYRVSKERVNYANNNI